MKRRTFLKSMLAAAAGLAFGVKPSKTPRYVVGVDPGFGTDAFVLMLRDKRRQAAIEHFQALENSLWSAPRYNDVPVVYCDKLS